MATKLSPSGALVIAENADRSVAVGAGAAGVGAAEAAGCGAGDCGTVGAGLDGIALGCVGRHGGCGITGAVNGGGQLSGESSRIRSGGIVPLSAPPYSAKTDNAIEVNASCSRRRIETSVRMRR